MDYIFEEGVMPEPRYAKKPSGREVSKKTTGELEARIAELEKKLEEQNEQ